MDFKFFEDIKRTPKEQKYEDWTSKIFLEYEKKFNTRLYLECFPVDKKFWETLERCIKENRKIEEFYPGINDYKPGRIY